MLVHMEVVLYGGTVLKSPSLPRRANMSFCPRHYHFSGLHSSSLFPIGFLLPSSSFISLPLLTLSLASSLPLSAFALHQCPEERGGAFQRPGDHSPLSASGPQSDRGIRIRIAVHSPQCPSDELEGAREGETEGAGGRRGMKGGGVPHTLRAPIGLRHSLCFYIAAVSFKFVLHILAHMHATHVHARVNIHTGVQGLNTCTLGYGNLHTYIHCQTKTCLQRQREQFSAEESEVVCGCVSMELESVIANAELMMNITLLRLRFWNVLTYMCNSSGSSFYLLWVLQQICLMVVSLE